MSELELYVKCPHCEKLSGLEGHEISSSAQDCELCGSHGEVDLYATCSHCEKRIVKTLSSW